MLLRMPGYDLFQMDIIHFRFSLSDCRSSFNRNQALLITVVEVEKVCLGICLLGCGQSNVKYVGKSIDANTKVYYILYEI